MLSTPVFFIFFNRPEVSQRTFARIRDAQPQRLRLIADGPRAHKAGEAELCKRCRESVEAMIDWPCEVTRDYSEQNLGCGRRLSSGLTRSFADLGEGIVLEDDILPHPDFFDFCAENLARYRDNPRIHSVGGFNPLGRYSPRDGAVVATLHNSIWGWASWQRSWKDYRFDLSPWRDPAVQQQARTFCGDDLLFQHYSEGINKTLSGELDTWDYQWTFSMLQQQRHCLASTTNLVENIGFSGDATHTSAPEPWLAGLRAEAAVATSRIPDVSLVDRTHDRLYNTVIMSGSPWKIRLARAAARSRLLRGLLAR